MLCLKSIHEYSFVVISSCNIKCNSHVNDANTEVINTIYRHLLSVLLSELHSYAYTGHCQACVCMCMRLYYKEKY